MKKIIALFLASILLAGALAGCKKEKTPSEASEPSSSQAVEESLKDGAYTATYSIPALDRTIDYLAVTVAEGKMKITEYTAKEPAAPTGSGSSAASSSQAASGEASSDANDRATTEETVQKMLVNILDQYEDSGEDLNAITPELHGEEHAYRFVRMMRELEAAALKGDTSPIILGKYADGSYKATMPAPNAEGWTEYVEVTVSGNEIANVLFDATKDGKKITEDDASNVTAPKPSEYYPGIATAFIDAAEDLTKVFPPEGGALAARSFAKLMNPLMASMMSAGEKQLVAPKYIDGTYKAEFADFDENGWKDYVVVEIRKGVPALTQYDSIHKDDPKKKRSSDKELGAKMKEATGTYSFDEIEEQLAAGLEKAKGDALKIENVAGATVSTNNVKLLVGELLATIATEGDNQETLVVERVASVKK